MMIMMMMTMRIKGNWEGDDIRVNEGDVGW